MAQCPAWFYYYAALAIDAEEGADTATLAVETYEQLLAGDYKKLPAMSDLTQTEIKRHFRSDPKWQALKEQETKLRTNAKLLDKAAKALEMKSRMLMSINKRDMYKKGVFTVEQD